MTPMSIRGSLLTPTAVVALALMLTGCTAGSSLVASPSQSAGDVVSTASTSPSPSAPAPSPASPTPTAAESSPSPSATASSPSATETGPAVDPDDPASWLVSFDGIGPLVIGGSIAAPVTDVLTESTDLVTTLDVCRGFTGKEVDALVVIAGGDPDFIGGVVVSGDEEPAGYPRTPAGIGAGSTEEELLAVYPGAVLSTTGYGRSYSITDGGGRYVHFALGGGTTVRGLHVLHHDELPSEFCT